MKKIVLLGLAIILFTACKATYSRSAQSDLKGAWTITDVSYSQNDINVKALGLMDAKCFKNSLWNFAPNNQTGNFQSEGSQKCASQQMNFKWYITLDNQFGLKFLEEDVKAKKILSGYLFGISNQTENSFKLTQSASLDGKSIQIYYQFTKN